MKEIKGFIFDLDGVIVDTARYHFMSWKKLAGTLGFDLDDKIEERLKGISRMHSLEIVLDAGKIESSQEEKVKMAAQKNDWYLDSLKDVDDSVVLPGVFPFLEGLKTGGYKLAVGSASKNATTLLTRLDMTDYFVTIIDGNMVEKTKPDPEVFINAARDLQIREDHCMVFEDSVKGIKAAIKGGFNVIGIGQETILGEADAVIPSFLDHDYESIISLLS